MICNYKKALILSMIILSLLLSCSKKVDNDPLITEADNIINSYMNRSHSSESNYKCLQITDAIVYPSPWTQETANTFSISEAKLKEMSTCGLIQTYLNQPWNLLGPWCTTCNNSTINGIDYFNDRIANNVIATELFTRHDGIEKLLIRYINYMQNLKSIVDKPGTLYSFELLLACEQFNNKSNDIISDQLLILAIKMIDIKKDYSEFKEINSLAATRHIMLNILLKSHSDLFSKEPLKVGMLGYEICYEDSKIEALTRQYLMNR